MIEIITGYSVGYLARYQMLTRMPQSLQSVQLFMLSSLFCDTLDVVYVIIFLQILVEVLMLLLMYLNYAMF